MNVLFTLCDVTRRRGVISQGDGDVTHSSVMIISYCYAENVISINTVQPVGQQTRPCLHLNPTNWNVFQLEETLKLFISSARFTFFFSKWKPFTEKLRSEEMCVYIEPYSVSVCILGPHPLLSCITYQGEYLII